MNNREVYRFTSASAYISISSAVLITPSISQKMLGNFWTRMMPMLRLRFAGIGVFPSMAVVENVEARSDGLN